MNVFIQIAKGIYFSFLRLKDQKYQDSDFKQTLWTITRATGNINKIAKCPINLKLNSVQYKNQHQMAKEFYEK